MTNKLLKILSSIKDIDGWKINEEKVESSELFFVKKQIDMNRGKRVHKYQVTVYKNFEEDGNKYTGSSTINISPNTDEDEVMENINEASFAASFVKNQAYPLVKPCDTVQPNMESKFFQASIAQWLPKLTEAIFKADNKENGCVNSAELFLNKKNTRIMNSEGLDVSYDSYSGQLEFITNWTEEGEEIELFKDIKFSDYNPDMIAGEVENMLNISKEKAMAVPTPSLKNQTVILTGSPLKKFFSYYFTHSNAQAIYEKISTAKLNENIQGEDIKSDLVTITLDPFLKNSSISSPYDNDGFPLQKVAIFEDGILKNYWGDQRFSSYLDIKPTGRIDNFIVECGSKSIDELKNEPYLELIEFSDFQMNPLTGDFAGEIRLGRYYDGNKVIPVTGGSISGNIKEAQKNMYLSKEMQQDNNFVGPKSIQLFNIDVAGN